jgi:hypothetical protein
LIFVLRLKKKRSKEGYFVIFGEGKRKEERPTRTNCSIVADMCYIERKRM